MNHYHTPTATRTGIVIGGAYTPQRSASYADPIEHPVTRCGHCAVVYVSSAILAVLAVLLIAGAL